MSAIVYSGKSYRNIVINIAGNANFNEILKKVNSVFIHEKYGEEDQIRYAMLELLNNSLRAHRERNLKGIIKLKIKHREDGYIFIVIQDQGGGFDTGKLPYNIEHDPENIDVNSEDFQEYREQNQYQRFGMGLLVMKKVFTDFRILFYDDKGAIYKDWDKERTKGTIIEMKLSEKEKSENE